MVSRAKRTDYGLVSCQYARDVIAGIDRKWERERRAKQHGAFSLHKKVYKKDGAPTQTPSTLH